MCKYFKKCLTILGGKSFRRKNIVFLLHYRGCFCFFKASLNTSHRGHRTPALRVRAVCLVSVGIKYFVSFSKKMTSHGTSQVNYQTSPYTAWLLHFQINSHQMLPCKLSIELSIKLSLKTCLNPLSSSNTLSLFR